MKFCTFLHPANYGSLQIWNHTHRNALISFDLGNSVGDVTWSPYSSTTFSAVTSDGKVHIYDLYENKKDPLCSQKIVKRAKLTKIRFNPDEYLLIVGDDKAGVNSFKLSPNLRKIHLPDLQKDNGDQTKDLQRIDPVQIQRKNIENVSMMFDTKPTL